MVLSSVLLITYRFRSVELDTLLQIHNVPCGQCISIITHRFRCGVPDVWFKFPMLNVVNVYQNIIKLTEGFTRILPFNTNINMFDWSSILTMPVYRKLKDIGQ